MPLSMPVLARRLRSEAFENFDEIVIVNEADPVANLVYRQIGVDQELDGLVHPDLMQIMDQGLAGFFLNRVLT